MKENYLKVMIYIFETNEDVLADTGEFCKCTIVSLKDFNYINIFFLSKCGFDCTKNKYCKNEKAKNLNYPKITTHQKNNDSLHLMIEFIFFISMSKFD